MPPAQLPYPSLSCRILRFSKAGSAVLQGIAGAERCTSAHEREIDPIGVELPSTYYPFDT